MLHHVVTLARDPYHLSVVAKTPPPETDHSPNRAFFAWRSATRSSFRLGFTFFHVTRAIALPGRTTQVFPSAFRRPTAFLGFNRPFAGFIPQPGGRATFASHGAFDQHTVVLVVIDISAGPGPRAVRASASVPIDFRRGDRSPVGVNKICKSDRPGMRMASTSGL